MAQDSSPSDPNQQCPANWNPYTTPVRACGRLTGGLACDSAIFSSNNQLYSHVCGRVIAYQRGDPEALNRFSHNLEMPYIDGVSLTHGAAGSRQHIWSFAAARWCKYIYCVSMLKHQHQLASPVATLYPKQLFLRHWQSWTWNVRYCSIRTRLILCGMVRGVVLPAAAANSTPLHGSALHCHNRITMMLNCEFAPMELEVAVKIFLSN